MSGTIAEGCLVEVQRQIDAAMQALENHADNGPPALVGAAYGHVLQARGQLAAYRQLLELHEIERAKTEPPVRLVR